VHAESDFLPGLVVDRYGEHLVVQLLTLGVEQQREVIVAALVEATHPRSVSERSDADVRAKEGLGVSSGLLWGEQPPELIELREHDRHFLVDVRRGHKTGFYLDQRDNRARLPAFCAGAEVLDAFAYSGGFAAYAATGGAAHVTLVDSSGPALALAERTLALNAIAVEQATYVEGDVFRVLRAYRAEGRRFDVVVVDPPKLAASARDVERAARAYKDANLLAFQLLRPGGALFTFSCSGSVSAELFQKVVFAAALDSGRDAQIVGTLTQASDHPVALTFPEGAYLKGLICQVSG
jgi:23S rRNA (cytosine1962-C5)-methyltransferase